MLYNLQLKLRFLELILNEVEVPRVIGMNVGLGFKVERSSVCLCVDLCLWL